MVPCTHMILCCLLVLRSSTIVVQSFPTGAPDEQCDLMTPSHGDGVVGKPLSEFTGQYTGIPTSYKCGQKIKFTMSGTYKGLLMQARKSDLTTRVGTWELPSGKWKKGCSEKAITHTNNTAVTDVEFTWVAPSTEVGDGVFILATVVEAKLTFYVKVKSAKMTETSCMADGGSGGSRLASFGKHHVAAMLGAVILVSALYYY